MISLCIAIIGVAVLVFAGEYLQRIHRYHPEITRKFIHISVATFAASWPFFMDWRYIQLASLFLFMGVVVSRHLHYFKAIHTVKRQTWGELFYAMSIGIVAVLSQHDWVFTAAMLHMGLADGMAALVGTLFGKAHRYSVFGHTKSRAGTATFLAVSILIVTTYLLFSGTTMHWSVLLWLPLLTTVGENVGVAGTDNLIVPLIITIALH